MKSIKFNQQSEMWYFFRDYYSFIQEFNCVESEQEFDALIEKTNEILNKYTEEEQFMRDLLVAHLRAVERRFKSEK